MRRVKSQGPTQMGGRCVEEQRDKNHQKKVWSRERSGQKKECLHGNNLAPEAGGTLLKFLQGRKTQ